MLKGNKVFFHSFHFSFLFVYIRITCWAAVSFFCLQNFLTRARFKAEERREKKLTLPSLKIYARLAFCAMQNHLNKIETVSFYYFACVLPTPRGNKKTFTKWITFELLYETQSKFYFAMEFAPLFLTLLVKATIPFSFFFLFAVGVRAVKGKFALRLRRFCVVCRVEFWRRLMKWNHFFFLLIFILSAEFWDFFSHGLKSCRDEKRDRRKFFYL